MPGNSTLDPSVLVELRAELAGLLADLDAGTLTAPRADVHRLSGARDLLDLLLARAPLAR